MPCVPNHLTKIGALIGKQMNYRIFGGIAKLFAVIVKMLLAITFRGPAIYLRKKKMLPKV